MPSPCAHFKQVVGKPPLDPDGGKCGPPAVPAPQLWKSLPKFPATSPVPELSVRTWTTGCLSVLELKAVQ